MKKNFFIKFFNSVIAPKFLWNLFINKKDYDQLSSNDFRITKKTRIFESLKYRSVIIPNLLSAKNWKNISNGQPLSYENYIKINDVGYALVKEIEERANKNDGFLDIGCNVGRFLNYLYFNGFRNLKGVDINKNIIEYSKKVFPDLPSENIIVKKSIEELLMKSKNHEYDIVYTHGHTVELIHRTYPLVKHLSRISKKFIILLIQEIGMETPRMWEYEFNKYGFDLIKLERFNKIQSLFVFKNRSYSEILLNEKDRSKFKSEKI